MQQAPALDWAEMCYTTIDCMNKEQNTTSGEKNTFNNSVGVQYILFISRSPFRSHVFVLEVKVCAYRGRLTINVSCQTLRIQTPSVRVTFVHTKGPEEE